MLFEELNQEQLNWRYLLRVREQRVISYSILVEELKGRDYMVDLGVDGRVHGNVTQSRSVTKT
jgi:hypothetical protein